MKKLIFLGVSLSVCLHASHKGKGRRKKSKAARTALTKKAIGKQPENIDSLFKNAQKAQNKELYDTAIKNYINFIQHSTAEPDNQRIITARCQAACLMLSHPEIKLPVSAKSLLMPLKRDRPYRAMDQYTRIWLWETLGKATNSLTYYFNVLAEHWRPTVDADFEPSQVEDSSPLPPYCFSDFHTLPPNHIFIKLTTLLDQQPHDTEPFTALPSIVSKSERMQLQQDIRQRGYQCMADSWSNPQEAFDHYGARLHTYTTEASSSSHACSSSSAAADSIDAKERETKCILAYLLVKKPPLSPSVMQKEKLNDILVDAAQYGSPYAPYVQAMLFQRPFARKQALKKLIMNSSNPITKLLARASMIEEYSPTISVLPFVLNVITNAPHTAAHYTDFFKALGKPKIETKILMLERCMNKTPYTYVADMAQGALLALRWQQRDATCAQDMISAIKSTPHLADIITSFFAKDEKEVQIIWELLCAQEMIDLERITPKVLTASAITDEDLKKITDLDLPPHALTSLQARAAYELFKLNRDQCSSLAQIYLASAALHGHEPAFDEFYRSLAQDPQNRISGLRALVKHGYVPAYDDLYEHAYELLSYNTTSLLAHINIDFIHQILKDPKTPKHKHAAFRKRILDFKQGLQDLELVAQQGHIQAILLHARQEENLHARIQKVQKFTQSKNEELSKQAWLHLIGIYEDEIETLRITKHKKRDRLIPIYRKKITELYALAEKHANCLLDLIKFSLETKNIPRAEKLLHRYRADHPEDTSPLILLGQAYMKQNKLAPAWKALFTFLKETPILHENRSDRSSVAKLLFDIIDSYIDIDSTTARTWRNKLYQELGMNRMRKGDTELLRTTIETYQTKRDAPKASKEKKAFYQEAIKHIYAILSPDQQACSSSSGSGASSSSAARTDSYTISSRAGASSSSSSAATPSRPISLDAALKAFAKDACNTHGIHVLQAFGICAKEDPEKANRILQKFTTQAKTADDYLLLGRMHHILDDNDAAIKAYKRASENQHALYSAGMLLQEKAYSMAASEPDKARALTVEAEGYMRKALAINPENDQALFALGSIYDAQKSYTPAATFFEKAAARGNVHAQFALTCYIQNGSGGCSPSPEKALDLIRKVTQTAPSSFPKAEDLATTIEYQTDKAWHILPKEYAQELSDKAKSIPLRTSAASSSSSSLVQNIRWYQEARHWRTLAKDKRKLAQAKASIIEHCDNSDPIVRQNAQLALACMYTLWAPQSPTLFKKAIITLNKTDMLEHATPSSIEPQQWANFYHICSNLANALDQAQQRGQSLPPLTSLMIDEICFAALVTGKESLKKIGAEHADKAKAQLELLAQHESSQVRHEALMALCHMYQFYARKLKGHSRHAFNEQVIQILENFNLLIDPESTMAEPMMRIHATYSKTLKELLAGRPYDHTDEIHKELANRIRHTSAGLLAVGNPENHYYGSAIADMTFLSGYIDKDATKLQEILEIARKGNMSEPFFIGGCIYRDGILGEQDYQKARASFAQAVAFEPTHFTARKWNTILNYLASGSTAECDASQKHFIYLINYTLKQTYGDKTLADLTDEQRYQLVKTTIWPIEQSDGSFTFYMC